MPRKTSPRRPGSSQFRAWQETEYRQNMRIKKGDLVWDPTAHSDRFGARGDFVEVMSVLTEIAA